MILIDKKPFFFWAAIETTLKVVDVCPSLYVFSGFCDSPINVDIAYVIDSSDNIVEDDFQSAKGWIMQQGTQLPDNSSKKISDMLTIPVLYISDH